MDRPIPFVRKKDLNAVVESAQKATNHLLDSFVDNNGVVDMNGIGTAFIVMISQYFKHLTRVKGKSFAFDAFNQFADHLRIATLDCIKDTEATQ